MDLRAGAGGLARAGRAAWRTVLSLGDAMVKTADVVVGNTPAPRTFGPEKLERLEELKRLRDEGALTSEEFAQQRALLLRQ